MRSFHKSWPLQYNRQTPGEKMTTKQQKALALEKLYESFSRCTECPLLITREHHMVCGQGNPNASLMLIGEAPGRLEDEQGLPFVGKSGMLLTKALECLSIDRKDIFITNSVKCRPPENRKPTFAESKQYKTLFLLQEIAIIKPRVICTLGATALECLLETPIKMEAMHGKSLLFEGITLIPAYHPAYVLRNPAKFETWFTDLEKAWNEAKKHNKN
jgi:uracil-DNA glycosylase